MESFFLNCRKIDWRHDFILENCIPRWQWFWVNLVFTFYLEACLEYAVHFKHKLFSTMSPMSIDCVCFYVRLWIHHVNVNERCVRIESNHVIMFAHHHGPVSNWAHITFYWLLRLFLFTTYRLLSTIHLATNEPWVYHPSWAQRSKHSKIVSNFSYVLWFAYTSIFISSVILIAFLLFFEMNKLPANFDDNFHFNFTVVVLDVVNKSMFARISICLLSLFFFSFMLMSSPE